MDVLHRFYCIATSPRPPSLFVEASCSGIVDRFHDLAMPGSRKFYQRGSNSTKTTFLCVCVLVDEGREDLNTTKSGPIMAHIECRLGSLVIFQENRTSIAKEPYNDWEPCHLCGTLSKTFPKSIP